jgi:hypothetical protein
VTQPTDNAWAAPTAAAKMIGGLLGAIPVVGGIERAGLAAAKEAQAAITGAREIAARAPGELRVSTRLPTAVTATEDPLRQHLDISSKEILAEPNAIIANPPTKSSPNPQSYVDLLGRYPGYARQAYQDPQDVVRNYINQSAGNLDFIYRNVPQLIREEAPQWYQSANQFANQLAGRYGIERPSMYAGLAALSPQKDWYQNASLAERMVDIMHEKANVPMTSNMRALGPVIFPKPKDAENLAAIQGARLNDLTDPVQRAMWLRLYDEAENPKAFRTMSPTGLLGDYVMTGENVPAKVAWGSLPEIGKAMQAIGAQGNTDIISGLLGERHKVRSFYNNIALSPEEAAIYRDVTADTHAVAANQLRPLSGKSEAVGHSLKTAPSPRPADFALAPGSSVSGVQGLYGFNVDPVRVAADRYGILPQQMQSVTWEGIRSLFPRTWKTGANMQRVDDIWRAADRGDISVDEARQRIVDLAGGFKEPEWLRRSGLLAGPPPSSTYR